MIILHFHLQPQFKYELFHIYFTYYRVSVLFLQISPETPLITAFHMFAEKRVSALPVVDDKGIKYCIFCLLTSLQSLFAGLFYGRMISLSEKKLKDSIYCNLLYMIVVSTDRSGDGDFFLS